MPHRLATKLELITSFKALLAAFMADYDVFPIEIAKTYGKNGWREDLKAVLRKASGKGDATVFLFTDSQIKEESFVEDINNLLHTGELPVLVSEGYGDIRQSG